MGPQALQPGRVRGVEGSATVLWPAGLVRGRGHGHSLDRTESAKCPFQGQPGSSWYLSLVLRHLFKAWGFFPKRDRERADKISWSSWQVLGLCSVLGGCFPQARRTARDMGC